MTVHLVGAGPGDPDLITVRGAELIRNAQVILHDRLAEPLLALAGPDTRLVDVGKAPGAAPVSQARINELLVEYGKSHDQVVRLKGGDPYVFARGAEEVEALRAAQITYTVTPGISSVLAAPSAAGVPLTCRGVARTFTVLSGHDDPARWSQDQADALAGFAGTIVVMMGAAHIEAIAKRLIAAGADPTTPVAASHRATTDAQVVGRGSLGDLGEARIGSPAVFVIGDVAAIDLRPGHGHPDRSNTPVRPR